MDFLEWVIWLGMDIMIYLPSLADMENQDYFPSLAGI